MILKKHSDGGIALEYHDSATGDPSWSPSFRNEGVETGQRMIYRVFVRPLLFRCDPEWAHDQALDWGNRISRRPTVCGAIDRWYRVKDERLSCQVAGMTFDNPIGLAAGFDKSGRAVPFLTSLGFGHVEIGSISARPSSGNPKPRLWRLPKDEATCVHYGLPNDGIDSVAKRLESIECPVPLGINLVNTNDGPAASCTAAAIIDDYLSSVRRAGNLPTYLTLNLSCPNTADGREFFSFSDNLEQLLKRLDRNSDNVPVFLKISPDLADDALDQLIETAMQFSRVKGLMFNLSSIRREESLTDSTAINEIAGAISGKPTCAWMDHLVAKLYRRIDHSRLSIISAGGIGTAEAAYRRIRLGASLVQIYTSLIYRGPGIVRRINRGLLRLMQRDGFSRLDQIIGIDAKLKSDSPVP